MMQWKVTELRKRKKKVIPRGNQKKANSESKHLYQYLVLSWERRDSIWQAQIAIIKHSVFCLEIGTVLSGWIIENLELEGPQMLIRLRPLLWICQGHQIPVFVFASQCLLIVALPPWGCWSSHSGRKRCSRDRSCLASWSFIADKKSCLRSKEKSNGSVVFLSGTFSASLWPPYPLSSEEIRKPSFTCEVAWSTYCTEWGRGPARWAVAHFGWLGGLELAAAGVLKAELCRWPRWGSGTGPTQGMWSHSMPWMLVLR